MAHIYDFATFVSELFELFWVSDSVRILALRISTTTSF